jgi:hypothetical protein
MLTRMSLAQLSEPISTIRATAAGQVPGSRSGLPLYSPSCLFLRRGPVSLAVGPRPP